MTTSKSYQKNPLDLLVEQKNKAINQSFLKNWTPEQLKVIEGAISSHFRKGITNCKNWLGLAYTSTSSYAGYWVCNVQIEPVKYPNHSYVGFALTDSLKPYAILWDKDENEILLPLSVNVTLKSK